MKKYIISVLILMIFMVSCKKFMEPEPDNSITEETLLGNALYAEGVLMTAYTQLPNSYAIDDDVACDDAVTNDKNSTYRKMGLGEWRASFDPISKWSYAYGAIGYINKFLEIYQDVSWSNDPNEPDSINELINSLHVKRLKGEAYALRAWYEYYLLRNHSGMNGNTMLGFPIIRKTLGLDDNWALPRNTFAECVDSIFADLDTAIVNLPPTWVDNGDEIHDMTSGARYSNRVNGNAARAIKSRVALLAASPAYSDYSGVSWEEAATIAGDLLKELPGLNSDELHFYLEEKNSGVIWNRVKTDDRILETDNYPPSFYGNGNVNPSQDLVNTFPMANGYPIDDSNSGYDPKEPYLNRDPRLSLYIIYNGALFKGKPIHTYEGAEQDGINELTSSTRTGYYLRKLMSENVNLKPGNEIDATHVYTLVRQTEVLLNFAEAANEAWGPDGDPNGYGFTARSEIEELRARAGIDPDNYIGSVTSKDDMRKLIHNERRIELCFEGFRFWDIRRWDDTKTMTAPVSGMFITLNNDSSFTYKSQNVEDRIYDDYMIHGPIPYDETLKYDIKQNFGW